MQSKIDSREIIIGNETDELIKEPFQSLVTRYQIGVETSMKDSYFLFYSIHGMYYKRHKIILNRGEQRFFLIG